MASGSDIFYKITGRFSGLFLFFSGLLDVSWMFKIFIDLFFLIFDVIQGYITK